LFSFLRFINGIVEFDEKVMQLTSRLSAQQRSIRKIYWNLFYFLITMYCLGYKLIVCFYFYPPRTLDIQFFTDFCLGPPFVIHFVVFISTFFFLHNLYIRFETLNDLWKSLPVGLIAVPDQWTHLEIVILIDDIRLLHAELSELLKIFSQGYGPLLITFFASNYMTTLLNFFFAYKFSHISPELNFTKNFLRIVLNYLVIGQSIFTMMFIMAMASFINDKVITIIRFK